MVGMALRQVSGAVVGKRPRTCFANALGAIVAGVEVVSAVIRAGAWSGVL